MNWLICLRKHKEGKLLSATGDETKPNSLFYVENFFAELSNGGKKQPQKSSKVQTK
jgi:hypothetical protein